jgi:hypothetical protein
MTQKIEYILTNVLGTRDTIYLFDNFEDNLKKSAHFKEFKNEFWQESLTYIMELLPETNSRIIITCRYTIPHIRNDLIHYAPLKEMSEQEARKLMLFNQDYAGIAQQNIKEVYKKIGGNPKAIEDLGKLLSHSDMSWEAIKDSLEMVKKDMREFTLFNVLYSFLAPEEQSFFRRISVYQNAVEREPLKLQQSNNLDKNIQKLIDYSLLQEFEDIEFKKKYYQIHHLNREFIKVNRWENDEKVQAHENAAEYYLNVDVQSSTLDNLLQAIYHLKMAKKYNKMAEFIISNSKQMILMGFWDESIFLYNMIFEV